VLLKKLVTLPELRLREPLSREGEGGKVPYSLSRKREQTVALEGGRAFLPGSGEYRGLQGGERFAMAENAKKCRKSLPEKL